MVPTHPHTVPPDSAQAPGRPSPSRGQACAWAGRGVGVAHRLVTWLLLALASIFLATAANASILSAYSPHGMCAGSSQIDSDLKAESSANTLAAPAATSYQKVTQVHTTPERIRTLVHITLDNGQTLTATDGHPFKTEEGWRDAVLLKKGGKLLLGGGEEDPASPLALVRYASIADVRIEQERITTYNLEVAQLHTFLVGGDGVVVHNGRGGSNVGGNRSTGKQHEQNVADAINNQGVNTARRPDGGINTPFGWRFPDIEVLNPAGDVIAYLECKKGKSRYHASQRAKDEWIRRTRGIPTTVVRDL